MIELVCGKDYFGKPIVLARGRSVEHLAEHWREGATLRGATAEESAEFWWRVSEDGELDPDLHSDIWGHE